MSLRPLVRCLICLLTLALSARAQTITSVSPSTAYYGSTSPVTVSGSGFGSSTGTVTFNGTAATSINSWSNTSISVYIPAPVGPGTSVVVTTSTGVKGNTYTANLAVTPQLASLYPSSAYPGQTVTISGPNLGSCTALFVDTTRGDYPTSENSNSGEQITFTVPSNAVTGPMFALCSGYQANGPTLTIGASPNITSITPSGAYYPESVEIQGANFGSSGSVTFNGVAATTFNWTSTAIGAYIPAYAGTATVIVTPTGAPQSNSYTYAETVTPSITSLSPASGGPGATLTISGSNLAVCNTLVMTESGGASQVNATFNTSSVVATVPSGVVTGPVYLYCDGYQTNQLTFTYSLPTTVVLSSSSNPATDNTAVMLTATVTSYDGTPTGSVTFYDGSTSLGSASLSGTNAALSVNNLATGVHTITAQYQGATPYQPATSSPLMQTIGGNSGAGQFACPANLGTS